MIREVTSHKSQVTSLIQNSKFLILSCSFVFCILNFAFICYAKEITILYTGETHAMLYPCSCPKEPDGGVARRATLIKQLRKAHSDALLLDSGGFFSGGLMDEYTQNTDLDKQRAIVNLKAMELMKYDAVTLGDDEFNFGQDFLVENISKTDLTFLSCNVSPMGPDASIPAATKILPYIIKEIGETKIGIIGVTTLLAKQKSSEMRILEPKIAVKQSVEALRENNVNIIILLSHLGENEDLNLIKDVDGIDILLIGHSRAKEETQSLIGSTLIIRPSWQGRKLGKLSLQLEDNKITNYDVEELRLSSEISDDTDILSILPRCFSDNNCKKEGMTGICQEPGTLRSQCIFSEPSLVSLLIITPKLCNLCNTENVTRHLKTLFPGLVVSYLYYPDVKTAELINDFRIKALPVYLLGKEVEKEKGFDNLRENLEMRGSFYILKPQFSGVSYFLGREKTNGKLDLFISLFDKDTPGLLDAIKEFNPTVHFLAFEQGYGFQASHGNLEVEEYLRSVCVQKYYPAYFWDYIRCRSINVDTSWWEDCLDSKLDLTKIRICSRSHEAKELLRENISLNRELNILFGPSYLLDNQEIFATKGVPTKEELRKIIKR